MTQRLASLGQLWGKRAVQRALVVALALALLAAFAWRHGSNADAKPHYNVPQSAEMENNLGIRFSQAAVVADGGIVELRYVVLNTDKASKFQNDVKHPPQLKSERRQGIAWRTALMKQGHQLRPGQTYYILFLNNKNAIRSGESLEIDYGKTKLAHVPVR